jgi:hypothetical protein
VVYELYDGIANIYITTIEPILVWEHSTLLINIHQ